MSRWGKVGFVFRMAVRGFLRDRCFSVAASLAFYAFLSGFPLLLLGITISTLVLTPEEAVSQAEEVLRQYVPVGSGLIEDSLKGAVMAGGATAGLSVIVLLWSGTFMFTEATGALNSAWGMKVYRRAWRQVLIDSLLVLVTAVAVSLGMLYETFARKFGSGLTGGPERSEQGLTALVVQLLPSALVLVILLLLYRYLPQRQVRWREALPGAVLATTLFQTNQWLFRSYVRQFGGRYFEVYGPLSSVTVLLLWAYLAALTFLLGAEYSAAWRQAWISRAAGGGAPIMQPRNGVAANE